MDKECVFCRILEGEIPSHTVHETGEWIAFLDAEPVSRGHTLVVPKKHVETIHDAGEMDFMWNAVVKTANAVRDAFEPGGINVDQNNGEVAGQEVKHLHFHVTPRYTGDELEIDYDRSELEDGDEIAERIGSQMT
ncbi:MAG: HIT family protein [Candidatus Nanohaloarchaea archaeon]